MKQIAVGLMSGTSADGISAVVAQFQQHEFKILHYHTFPYSEPIKKCIQNGPNLNSAQISSLNVQLGEIFAMAVLKILKKAHVSPKKVLCVGSHGQTIYHGPHDHFSNTAQIGEPAAIAEITGIDVVSHFRQRDMAAGGEGAPLIPYFDHYFFGHGPVRAFQNVGGISNVAVVGKNVDNVIAFDTGPGNGLMDMAIQLGTHRKEFYDHLGARAKKGEIDMDLANKMLNTPYFKKRPPKSTGPEFFNQKYLEKYFKTKIKSKLNDVLATLNYFTCISIQEAYRNFIFQKYPVEEIVVSGGGALNKTLMHKLECLFAPIPVISIQKLGIPVQAKEPLAFAFFGLRAIQHRSNHLPSATGAKFKRILGSVTKA